MKARFIFALLVAFASAAALAQSPTPAKELLDKAQAQAKAQGKTVFVMFDASW